MSKYVKELFFYTVHAVEKLNTEAVRETDWTSFYIQLIALQNPVSDHEL